MADKKLTLNHWLFIIFIVIRTAADFLTDKVLFQVGTLAVNFTSLIGLIIIIFALVVFIHSGAWREKLPLVRSWLIFLLLTAVLIGFSLDLKISLTEWLRWSSFFALFVLGFCLWRGGKNVTILIKTLIFSSFIPMLAALWQTASDSGFFDGERLRANGTFVHPNMLAFYLVFVITLSLFIFLTLRREAVEKYFYLLLVLPLIATLIFTYTRGAWLCLSLTLLLIGLTRFRIFLISALLVLAIFYMGFPVIQERVNSLASFSATDSTVWRLDLWRDAFSYSSVHPLVGYGPGMAETVIGNNRSVILGSSEPHNDYIKIILETGALGLAAYLLLIVSLLANLWRAWRRENKPRQKLLFLFLLIFSLSFYIMSAGDNLLRDSALQWSFWALIGAAMYAYGQLKPGKTVAPTEN